jgi:hypothetical protein
VHDANTAIRPFEDQDEAAVVAVWHRSGLAAYPYLPKYTNLAITKTYRG